MKDLLSTNGLTKKFGRYKVVNAVNIHIRQGDIYGLIGRNGAGKTTILKMISGLVAPTEGDFSLFEKSGKAAYQYMSRIGTLIEAPGIYPNMSAYENMKLKCIAMGVRKQGVIEELLNTVGLGTVGKKKVKNFSLGMKQRLGIALALVGDPDLVILDEPINGLDPQGIAEVRETLFKLNKEKNITFIISSHILEELSKIATNYGIIHDGVLIKEMTREELLAECSERIELKTDDTGKACTVLENMGIHQYKVVDVDTIQIFERLNDGGSITMTLAENGVKTVGITIKNEALEDYYLNLTGGASNV
ncbi:ABC transporter ATP-binding protein [Faecalimonas umbilicata]|jgi:ABC-type multidrug transport system ATPase subunit|uniref:ABC transporter ATP-binding protein n=1 Tax=Faecalimonas umbilicata TaxID=1912855 RepID=UPI0022E1ED25|nr:ABC transporter ATP-binding protein [Faecalimonas umbilicata]